MSDGYRCDMCDVPMSRDLWKANAGTCNECLKTITINRMRYEREAQTKKIEEK